MMGSEFDAMVSGGRVSLGMATATFATVEPEYKKVTSPGFGMLVATRAIRSLTSTTRRQLAAGWWRLVLVAQ